MHLGPFGCLTELSAKRAELVQEFVPRNRVRIFRNKRTRSTPLDPKLTFCCVLYYLGAFGTVWLVTKLGVKRAELVQKFVPRSRVGIFRKERTRSTPLDPKLTFCCVSYYLGAFGTVWLPYGTRCKMGKTSPKVRAKVRKSSCHEVASEFLAMNAPDPTPMDPKLMFCWVLYYLGAFGTVWLPVTLRNSVRNRPN